MRQRKIHLKLPILKMPQSNILPPLIVLLGPTAVGKTKLSLELAKCLEAEIISVDSRLFYRGMNIGTAKPGAEELANVPHHLVDVAEPDQIWSLGKFQKEALQIIKDIHHRGKIPLCVGGTGQYIRAITEGWSIPEIKENPGLRIALRNWCEEIGKEGLYQRLKIIDPDAVEKIDPRNVRRTVRALEVIFSTGRRFSQQRSRFTIPYRVLQIGLTRPREELYKRIDQRVDAMITAGFLREVQALLETYSPDLRSFSAIGYSQMIKHLQGQITLEETVQEIKKQTRRFVGRQYAWFKPADPDIHWYSMKEDTLEKVVEIVEQFLIT